MDTAKEWTARHPVGSLVQFNRFGTTTYRVASPAFIPPSPIFVLLESPNSEVRAVQIDWVKQADQSPGEGGSSTKAKP